MGLLGKINKILSDVNTIGVGKVAPAIGKVLNKGLKKAPGVVESGAGALNKTIEKGRGFVGAIKDGRAGKAVEEGLRKTVRNTLTDESSYHMVGGPYAVSNKFLLADDLNRRAKQVGDTMAFAFDTASKDKIFNNRVKNPLQLIRKDENSLVGYKATKRGALLASGVMFAAGTPDAVKSYVDNRKGYNTDQQATTSAPRVPAYAQDAGATGDLVFALNNLRHGGMI